MSQNLHWLAKYTGIVSFLKPHVLVTTGDVHHINPARNVYSWLVCGTDHCSGCNFHFEVENNSLHSTGGPR
ncbi:hypothetical protein F9C28_04055 [Shimwellia pseudoproteus]|nr:hypothetical protein [Shimwellia pseudoproteus]